MKEATGDIADYKFYCFNGVPKLLLIIADRFTGETKTFFDMNGTRLSIHNTEDKPNPTVCLPVHFEQMKSIAEKLAEDFRFIRIDLYELDGKIYFGEYTFFAAGGFYPFHPDEWEKKLGDWIDLNN